MSGDGGYMISFLSYFFKYKLQITEGIERNHGCCAGEGLEYGNIPHV